MPNPPAEPVFMQILNDEVHRALSNGVSYLFGSGVLGDLAEFGTMTGRTATVLARFLAEVERYWGRNDQRHGIGRRSLHLFDSFSGLPAPEHAIDAASPHVQANIWFEGNLRGVNPEQLAEMVQLHLARDRVKIYQGFFSETLDRIPNATRFGLVHLDCDFYASALQVLDALLGRQLLSPGAILLFDDWNCNRADPAFGERRAWQDMLDKYRIHWSDGGDYSVFGHKLIVHGVEPRV